MRIAIYITKLAILSVILASSASHAWNHKHFKHDLIKHVTGGKIQGIIDKEDTESYRGIPYAKAPVHELRWKAPQDPETWDGVRDANIFGNICPQSGTIWGTSDPEEFDEPLGSEDCLFLNVWRPNTDTSNLPVFLWIHGGSDVRGSANSDTYNGAKLAKEMNAIVVTINFRLGALGWLYNDFLKSEDLSDSSGNYGLLDMIKALEWVQKNIYEFGGNPNRVTIAGNSSGCSSVWTLMQSPLSENLFDQAICSAGFPSATPKDVGESFSNGLIDNLLVIEGLADSIEEAIALRSNQTTEWIGNFMRSIPAEVLVSLVPRTYTNFIDGHVLENAGLDAIRAGHFHKKPMILGNTKNESAYFWGVLIGSFNHFGSNNPLLWEQLITDPELIEVSDILNPLYAPTYAGVVEASSYAWSLATDNLASYVSDYQQKVYRYDFNFDDIPAPWNTVFGATHTFDLPFLFGNFDSENDNLYSYAWTDENKQAREQISKDFMDYLGRFLRTGNPNFPINRFRRCWTNNNGKHFASDNKADWGAKRRQGNSPIIRPVWPKWNDRENPFFGRRVQFDIPTKNSAYRFSYEEYQSLYNTLDPFSQSLVDTYFGGLPIQ